MQGVVKFYNNEKGFGFIGTNKGDYFVHRSSVKSGTLDEGDKVTFDIESNERGNIAINVKKVINDES